MGKAIEQSYDEERQARENNSSSSSSSSSSRILYEQCSVLVARLSKDLSFKCVFVLVLSLSVLLYGVFSIVSFRPKNPGFDAQQGFKLSASAQAFFTLEKSVSELVPHIGRLEYDINEEIGVPNTKFVILSLHECGGTNRTAVVFGALPDPINFPISPVYLSVMKSSLIEVFMKQTNLTLTTTIFGHPSKFEILKFRGGITVIPEPASVWQMPQILFNFTLSNSISEIMENIVELKDQLKFGLQLRTYENVFVQITNVVGSTADSPVIIQASVTSNSGDLPLERLRQLAERITSSPARNLGLDHAVFGRVKSISLSSFFRGTLSSPSPSPSPGPTPEPSADFGPLISPGPAPLTPAPLPDTFDPPPSSKSPQSPPSPQPCTYHDDTETPTPAPSPSPLSYPIAPSAFTPAPIPHSLPVDPKSQWPPIVAPVPRVARAPSPGESKGKPQGLSSSAFSPAPSPSAGGPLCKTIWSLGLSALIIFYLLCWSN